MVNFALQNKIVAWWGAKLDDNTHLSHFLSLFCQVADSFGRKYHLLCCHRRGAGQNKAADHDSPERVADTDSLVVAQKLL